MKLEYLEKYVFKVSPRFKYLDLPSEMHVAIHHIQKYYNFYA